MWRISAEQLFNTVNGELVSCLGRKNRASQLNQRYSDVYHSAVNFSRGWQPWRTQDDTLGQVRKIWAVWLLHLPPCWQPHLPCRLTCPTPWQTIQCTSLHRSAVLVMATISKRRRNEALILASFSISKRNEPAYSRTCKDRSEENPAYSTP